MAFSINIMFALATIFRLFILALLIFGAITFLGTGQTVGNRALIASVIVLIYGMTDWLLNLILGLACSCRNHNGNKSSS